jgi:hypothetical protein
MTDVEELKKRGEIYNRRGGLGHDVHAWLDQVIPALSSLQEELGRVRHPFRNVDAVDWEYIINVALDRLDQKDQRPHFWRAVLMEAREALSSTKEET